jgi:hypothetical protein
MPDKKTLALGDLRQMLDKYRKELAAAKTKNTKAFRKDGSLTNVDTAKVDKAAKALEAAMSAVEEVCEEAVLAISVE